MQIPKVNSSNTLHAVSRCFVVALTTAFAGVMFLSTATADDATATDAKPAAKTESVSVFGLGTLEVPAEFKRAKVKSRIIQHEFAAATKEVDTPARVTMMGAGGGVAANIKRWQGQFAGGDPKKQKTEEMKLGDWTLHLVDCSGSYVETMGGGPFSGGKKVTRQNYAMAGAILVEPKGRMYFVKMIGPAEVVSSNREAFVKMMKSIED